MPVPGEGEAGAGENAPEKPMPRWWPYNDNPVLRTKTSLLKNSLDLATGDATVGGATKMLWLQYALVPTSTLSTTIKEP